MRHFMTLIAQQFQIVPAKRDCRIVNVLRRQLFLVMHLFSCPVNAVFDALFAQPAHAFRVCRAAIRPCSAAVESSCKLVSALPDKIISPSPPQRAHSYRAMRDLPAAAVELPQRAPNAKRTRRSACPLFCFFVDFTISRRFGLRQPCISLAFA